MRLPKLRELKEAVVAVVSPRFTTQFPARPITVPKKFRGKPEFDPDTCIGCGACVNVCPTVNCLTMVDDLESDPPKRIITHRPYACIFCGNCHDNCTTETGINLSNQWDLANLDKESTIENHEHELQMCEKCGAMIGTKKHLKWLYEKLGPLAYTNPSLLIAQSRDLIEQQQQPRQTESDQEVKTSDFMQILCPECKCKLNIRL